MYVPLTVSPPLVSIQVDVCLFDKTGTITSDRLTAETLVTPQPLHLNDPPVTVKLGRSTRGGVSDAALGSSGETVERTSMELAAKVRAQLPGNKLFCYR